MDMTDPTAAVAVLDQAAQVAPVAPVSEDVRQTLRLWREQARVPAWLREAWNRWKADREYLHTNLFADGQARQFSVNLAARVLFTKLSHILPTDADLTAAIERGVESVQWVRRDAIREAKAQADAAGIQVPMQLLLAAADKAEQEYRQELEARERWGATSEALGKKLGSEANLTPLLRQFALSAFTVGPAWIKIGWQSDYGRDSLGNRRRDDAQDQLKRLALRAAEFAAGEFGEDDPRHDELMHLSAYARERARKVMLSQDRGAGLPFDRWEQIADTRDDEPLNAGLLPEVDRWQGATIDLPQPERMRWDWRFPLSRWQESPWIAEQVLMDLDQAAALFSLTPEEKAFLGNPNRQHERSVATAGRQYQSDSDPAGVDDEAPIQRGQVVIWDRWDRANFRHTVWCEGLDRYLLDEVPAVTTPWFYPWWCLGFNWMDGAQVPPSDVRFLRKIQDAINQRLTDGQESLWASMKRYLVKRGAFKDGELDKLRGAVPHDTIEVETPEEVKATIMELASDDWNAEKYDLSQLFRLLELVMGMSLSQLGVVNVAEFATEAKIAESQSQMNAGRHQVEMDDAVAAVYLAILTYAGVSMSGQSVKRLVGRAAYWPPAPTREALLRQTRMRVKASGSAAAARGEQTKKLRDGMGAMREALAVKREADAAGVSIDLQALLAPILRAIDVEAPLREVVRIIQPDPVGMPMVPAGAVPGQQPGPAQAIPQPGAAAPGINPSTMP